ncbi:MAG: IPT/TIG domain-containing protein [Candidatus Margulisbacteria bacterium]|nr:IPT/TIG domain-containing protein [Candidatus Margulisiibacteriota bacterium]
MAAPTVTSVTPATGTYAGGTAVLVVGTNFTTATAVTIGGQSADFEVSSATLLAATTPAGTGASQVIVTNPDGSSSDDVDFTYTGSPALFSVTEARAYDKAQLTSATTYPSATITAKEVDIRTRFERIIGVALTSTTSTEYYDGDGSDTLLLKHHMPYADETPSPVTLTSVTVIDTDDTETAFTVAELADVVKYPYKLVRRSGYFDIGDRNIKVVYTHGYSTVPTEIQNAALQVLLLPPPDGLVPGSAPSMVIDGSDGAINWSRIKDPARGKWFGSEAIDSILRYHRSIEKVPVIW